MKFVIYRGCASCQRFVPLPFYSAGLTPLQIVHAGCDGDATEGSFARNVSALWAERGDFFFSDYGNVLAYPNIIEVNLARKIIFAPITPASTMWRCRPEWMAAGLQEECRLPRDKRFPYAYSMYVIRSITLSL